MKKLFFTALVAVVAVGGALTSNATTYYGNSRNYDCTGTSLRCNQISEPVFSDPEKQQLVPAAEIAALPNSVRYN